MAADEPQDESRCSNCGAPFRCGLHSVEGCWCAQLPRLAAPAIDADRGCLCPRCLSAAVAAQRERRA